jgi:serine/threonine-protein kinase
MTVMFTDVVSSVAMKSTLGMADYSRAISRHDELCRECVAAAEGEVIKDTGDGFMAGFASSSHAVAAALRFQRAIASEPWPRQPLRVRIGLHVGEVAELEKDVDGRAKVVGLAADVAARLMSLALPGQILLSRAVFDDARQYLRVHPAITAGLSSAGSRGELRWMAHGRYLFQGGDDPLEVFEVGSPGEAPLQAPPGSDKVRRATSAADEPTLGWRPAAGLEIPRRENWVLDRQLGIGGFGEVWLARHAKTDQHRVFKFCFDADKLRSFRRELTLFRLLREALGDRPDIAQLYDIQLDEPPFFIESEFTEAGNLSDWAKARGGIAKVPLATRLNLAACTADALAAAHSIGVLHKDV